MGKVVALKDSRDERTRDDQPHEGHPPEEHPDAASYDESLLEDLENLDQGDIQEALEIPEPEHHVPETTFRLEAKLSALLFTAPRPLTSQQLAQAAGAEVEAVEDALERLKSAFQPEIHGISLCEVAGALQLRTAPGLAKVVQRLIPPRAKRLSRAAAETLAVVAYKQPVQRAEIEAIRGVDALPTLKTLLDARLIRIVGREASAGQPALYGTTHTFLEKFGLRDLSELPTIRELAQLSSEPGESAMLDASGEDSQPQEDELFDEESTFAAQISEISEEEE